MGFMQAEPRVRRDNSKRFLKHIGTVFVLAGGVVACGGGGQGSEAEAPITRMEAVVGDYFVYEHAHSAPVSASSPPYTTAQTIRSMASDGRYQRVVSASISTSSGASQATFDVNDATISLDPPVGITAASCSHSLPFPAMPPYPRSVGQTWSGTSTRSCDGYIETVSGRIVAREELVLPAGRFDAFRFERTSNGATSLATFLQTSTCWVSVQRGVLLRCDTTSTTTLANASAPPSVVPVTQVLIGLGGPSRASVGDVLQRFAGEWRILYTGAATGACSQLRISAAGAISGNCLHSGNATSFAVTGTVNTAGVLTITLPAGSTFSGTLANPYSGSGTWVHGGAAIGDWTAARR